ncbi:oxidoreductase, partial [Salmonella enterica subsp. enterica serovar Oranienburg]|nr:oxidoreductase [Salmonella enterica subsp. enterica serovar Oranienburg]
LLNGLKDKASAAYGSVNNAISGLL